jgi:Zn-dependent protease with chaperone function
MPHTRWIAFTAGMVLSIAGFATGTSEPVKAGEPPAPVSPTDEPERSYLHRDFSFVASPEIEGYLAQVADKLLATRPKPITRPRIIVYSSSGFNAMADSLKTILISTETLQQLESEDELAALLGHELSHVMLGHSEKKSLLGRFPLSVETMGEIAATGDQVKADIEKQKASGQPLVGPQTTAAAGTAIAAKPTEFAQDSVKTSQNVSLFWSDLLMPNWNKNDEREADRVGYDMVRAAGYDVEAFATLFQKLRDAQLKRSARMEQLRVSMVQRAQQRELPVTGSGEFATELRAAGEELRKQASEKTINALFDGMAKMSKDYDSPEVRQDLLLQHAAKQPPLDEDKKPRSPLFAKTLREGTGGALLAADLTALHAVAAMEAGDLKLAGEKIAPLLPTPPAAKPAKKAIAKGTSKGKKGAPAPEAKPEVTHPVQLASPHLNYALGKWLAEQGNGQAAELYAKQWMSYSRAPSKAFHWRAAFQADRAEFIAASDTLVDGARRLGSDVPFLPQRVTYARLANDMTKAQNLTRDCRTEEQKRKSKLRIILDVFRDSAPTGLYATCLANLGSPLPDDGKGLRNILTSPLRPGAKTVESLNDSN